MRYLLTRILSLDPANADPSTNTLYVRQEWLIRTWEMIKTSQLMGANFKDISLDFNTYYDTTFERKAGINLDN